MDRTLITVMSVWKLSVRQRSAPEPKYIFLIGTPGFKATEIAASRH